MSKECWPSLLGRPLRLAFVVLAVAFAVLAAAHQSNLPAEARIFAVAIVNEDDPGFRNNDFDVSDAGFEAFDGNTFPLTPSDGVPGNVGLNVDTFFAGVGQTVWIGISAEEGEGVLNIDSNDYGRFIKALCNDNNDDGKDFRDPSDNCEEVEGLNSDNLHIPDGGNSLDHVPLASLPRMGVAVAFECEDDPGVTEMTVEQGGFTFEFFMVCHGSLETTQLSATATELEIWPQLGSTAHSLLRVELFDESGGIVAGYEVQWSVNRCSVETRDVDGVNGAGNADLQEIIDVLSGATPISETVGPDSNPQVDSARNVVYDFNGDGVLEAVSYAVLHCEPGHSATDEPGPITVRVHIDRPDEAAVESTLVLNLIGPPDTITLSANPTQVQCGEKINVTAIIVDELGQAVSDFTPVEFTVNLGGTGTAGRIFGPVAPISSGIGRTFGGIATFYLLTSTANVGNYEVVAEAEGVFSTPPVTATVSVTCFVPATPVPTTAPAATTVAPAASAPASLPAIRPPSTGDGGLLP